jgi:hypothetical protein
MGTRFIRWNVRNLYRSGLLKAVSRVLAKNRFHLLVVQGVGGTGEALNEQRILQTFVEKEIHQFQLGYIVHKRTISAVMLDNFNEETGPITCFETDSW